MNPVDQQKRKREAWRRLRAQRQRAGQLRGRVVAISLIAFVLLWGVVFVQMATGNDPVLGNSSSTIAKRSGARNSHTAKAAPAETGARTDSEEVEATETSEPEEFEEELVEPEPVEEELVEAEPEAAEEEFIEEEPAPVTTSQS